MVILQFSNEGHESSILYIRCEDSSESFKEIINFFPRTIHLRVLERFRIENCNPIDTSMAKGEKLSNKLCPETPKWKEWMEKVPYASAMGSLMYAMLCTRPNIFYAVGMVSRYQSN